MPAPDDPDAEMSDRALSPAPRIIIKASKAKAPAKKRKRQAAPKQSKR
jgi:hypothetical protein